MGVRVRETLEEARERLLLARLEELDRLEAERLAKRREPSLSRKVEFTWRGLQFCENGHVFRALGQANEVYYGHLAYITDAAVRQAWEAYLAS